MKVRNEHRPKHRDDRALLASSFLGNRFSFERAKDSIIIRGLDGNIRGLNKTAEKYYGWSKEEAVGHVSHLLFNTIFPLPLDEINLQLLQHGYWEGELIHTMSDGSRVKVRSRWELQTKEDSQPEVVEINRVEEAISPHTAHFSSTSGTLAYLWRRKHWWLLPLLATLFVMLFLSYFTDSYQLLPFHV